MFWFWMFAVSAETCLAGASFTSLNGTKTVTQTETVTHTETKTRIVVVPVTKPVVVERVVPFRVAPSTSETEEIGPERGLEGPQERLENMEERIEARQGVDLSEPDAETISPLPRLYPVSGEIEKESQD